MRGHHPHAAPACTQAEGQEEGGQGQPAASGGAAAAVATAVGRRLEQMDGTFLATLDSYIQGASDRGAAEVAGGC